jgi:hypothetical protein
MSVDVTVHKVEIEQTVQMLQEAQKAHNKAIAKLYKQLRPVANHDSNAPSVGVRVANGRPERSVACATLALVPSLPSSAMQGHVMPSFTHTLIGLGPFTNLGCKIIFTKTAVTIYHPDGHPILTGWRDLEGPHLWHFPLQPN